MVAAEGVVPFSAEDVSGPVCVPVLEVVPSADEGVWSPVCVPVLGVVPVRVACVPEELTGAANLPGLVEDVSFSGVWDGVARADAPGSVASVPTLLPWLGLAGLPLEALEEPYETSTLTNRNGEFAKEIVVIWMVGWFSAACPDWAWLSATGLE